MKNLNTAFLARSHDLASQAHTQLTAARVLTTYHRERTFSAETYSPADLAWFRAPIGAR